MTVTERVAYLKGLAEGMELDAESKEGKMLNAIIDVLGDMAFEISDMQDVVGELGDQIDMIDEDLDGLEEVVYGDEDEDDDECCDEEDDEEYEAEGDLYEITCPTCGDSIYLDEDMLKEGEMTCPSCGEHLEFDLEDECDCEECSPSEDK